MAVRPIDAMELKQRMCALCNQDYSDEPCEPSDCVFVRAINEAPTLTPPNEWVSVEDAVPDPGVRVLAANGSFVGEAYMASNGAWMRHDGFPWKVDAWMPLPAPPDLRPPEGEEDK